MSAASRTCLLINPAAGRGRAARLAPTVVRAFGVHGVTDVRLTREADDERRVVGEALGDGCETIAVFGGDGTWSKVADAVLHAGAPCRLALVAGGTGNDFAKSLGAPAARFAEMARLAVEGPELAVDVGLVNGERHFLNVIGFGFDAAVVAACALSVETSVLSYARAAMGQLFGYRGTPMGVDRPGGAALDPHLIIAIANGRHYGGAFRIAPQARLDDGLLDAVVIRDASPLQRLQLFAAAIGGRHIRRPEVEVTTAARFNLAFDVPPTYQLDGELREAPASALTIECLPRALRVVTAGTA